MVQCVLWIAVLCVSTLGVLFSGWKLKDIYEHRSSKENENSAQPKWTVPATNKSNNKDQLAGLIMEGRRNNVLQRNCLEASIAFSGSKAELRKSLIAPEYKEAVVRVAPEEIVNLEFKGKPRVRRTDYTFSFIVYIIEGDSDKVGVTYSVSNSVEKASANFAFKGATPFISNKKNSIFAYRPEISSLYPAVPAEVVGKVAITNSSAKNISIAILFPTIEEGLFASSLIACGESRGGETLSYDRVKDTLAGMRDRSTGTISFVFNPSWHASRLTPGIDPHFFYWMSESEDNGIKIYADSRDNGKLKVVAVRKNKATALTSDVSPINGEIYSVDFRFDGVKGDLVVNGMNVSSTQKMDFPIFSKLPDRFYIGSNPKSEYLSAFCIIREVRIYPEWLSDSRIQSELFKRLPDRFSNFRN